MDPQPGCTVRIVGHAVGVPERTGTVLEVREGGRSIRVRRADGHESLFSPGNDATFEQSDDNGSSLSLGCQIDLRLDETEDHCEVVATLTASPWAFEGRGRARRHPDDPSVPMIGEELAIARALESVAAQLRAATDEAIARGEDEHVHLLGHTA